MRKTQRLHRVQHAMLMMELTLNAHLVRNPLKGTFTSHGVSTTVMSSFALGEGSKGPVLYIDGKRGRSFPCQRQNSAGWNGFVGGTPWRSFIEAIAEYITTGLQMLDPRFFGTNQHVRAPLTGCDAECRNELKAIFRFVMAKPSPGLETPAGRAER